MKILGRIKKSKVLTAVMTAVLIFQSACPTGLAYAAQKSGVSAYAAGQTIDQALGATKTSPCSPSTRTTSITSPRHMATKGLMARAAQSTLGTAGNRRASTVAVPI